MKQLTKKQKIFVLKEMIRYYKYIKDCHWCSGMCFMIENISVQDLDIVIDNPETYDYQKKLFPEFNMFKPKGKGGSFWFEVGESEPRLKYCKKILKLIESK
jgi:hypothetical protein